MALGLGRRVPTDFRHYERYSLSLATTPTKPVPCVIGISWYAAMDRPEKVGNDYYIGRDLNNLGPIRGGHCVCIKPDSLTDPTSWWDWYDQGQEGSCVGFGSSRMMSLLNRKRYDARWLYHEAQLIDEWSDTPPGEGTSVRAGMDVLRTLGHKRRFSSSPDASEGVAANHWASAVDEMRWVLQSPSHDKRGAFPILNNWGRGYPHVTWLTYECMARLLGEQAECTLVTDR